MRQRLIGSREAPNGDSIRSATLGVLMLAGGAIERERFGDVPDGVCSKAALPLAGRSVVWWTLQAALGLPAVERIAVVGGPELGQLDLEGDRVVLTPERGSIASNLAAGLEELSSCERVLILAADLPLLTPPMIEEFAGRAPEADFVFAYCEKSDVEREFPGRGWIYARTAEGDLTGSGVGLCRPAALRAQWPLVEQLLESRRLSPLRLAMLFGAGVLIRYLAGRLRPSHVEERLSRQTGLTLRGYRSPHPELAMDIDKQGDLDLAETILAARG